LPIHQNHLRATQFEALAFFVALCGSYFLNAIRERRPEKY
jgi:hypothetical protein